MKHLIPIIIILLMVSTSFVGVGNQVEELRVDNEQDELLDNLAFYCYDDSGFGSAKYEHLSEELLEEYPYQTDVVETESQSFVSNLIESSESPPMDSAWPMQCHDVRHTSLSPYSTASNPYDEKWRFKTDWVQNSPVIDNNGIIYFVSVDNKVIAVYPNCTLKWTFTTGGWMDGSTPAIAEDGTIYVGSWDCKLYAINPNGTRKWKCGTGGSLASSPVIADDGTIYIGTLNNDIVAINPNGTKKWSYETGYSIVSDPAIGDNGIIYIGSVDGYFYAMNPNGTLKWRFKTGDEIHGHPSIADDGTIYIGSFDDYLYALNPNGTMKWKSKMKWGTSGNPAIDEDGTIYVCSDKMYAIYPNNGTKKWTFKFGTEKWVGHSSPAISADGTIYIGTNKGEGGGGDIIAINSNGTELWRKKIATQWVDSSPCIAKDGTVYVGSAYNMTSGYLYAFGRAELKTDANGPHYGLINEPVQFNGTAYGGYRPYTWYWDFGDGNSSIERNPIHIYTEPGNYTVTLEVTDDSDNTSEDATWAWIQEFNNPPDKPTITGETNGKKDTRYEYTFLSSDPEGLKIWYYIEWGDGKNTVWIGPYHSDEQITKSHKWSEKGNYTIRCKAKDPYDDESEWGELRVTMPHSFWWFNGLLSRFPLLQRLLEILIR